MKKKILLIAFALLAIQFGYSQISYGIKGGVNYNFSGKLTELSTVTNNIGPDILHGAKNKAGFHVGFWLKTKFILGISIRPELVYTQLKTGYNISQGVNLTTQKLDLPILLDTKIIGPLHFFIGPSIQYILNSKFNSSDIKNINGDDFTIGMQLGTGVQLGNLGFDVRWEKGIKNKLTATNITKLTNLKVDNRPNQIIFSASIKL